MISGKVLLEGEALKGIVIYESDSTGKVLKRNDLYLNTTSNDKGEYSLNIPKSNNFYVTYRLTGADLQTYKTNSVPAIVNLKTSGSLPEVEVTAPKKFNYLWLLLLLIPLLLKKRKK